LPQAANLRLGSKPAFSRACQVEKGNLKISFVFASGWELCHLPIVQTDRGAFAFTEQVPQVGYGIQVLYLEREK